MATRGRALKMYSYYRFDQLPWLMSHRKMRSLLLPVVLLQIQRSSLFPSGIGRKEKKLATLQFIFWQMSPRQMKNMCKSWTRCPKMFVKFCENTSPAQCECPTPNSNMMMSFLNCPWWHAHRSFPAQEGSVGNIICIPAKLLEIVEVFFVRRRKTVTQSCRNHCLLFSLNLS